MSPELKLIYNNNIEEINFNPEKSDFIFIRYYIYLKVKLNIIYILFYNNIFDLIIQFLFYL